MSESIMPATDEDVRYWREMAAMWERECHDNAALCMNPAALDCKECTTEDGEPNECYAVGIQRLIARIENEVERVRGLECIIAGSRDVAGGAG